MRRPALLVVLAALLASAVSVQAQAPRALVVQAATEPPGLDLTATPASATAGVVLYNVQECSCRGWRSAGTPPITAITPSF